MNMNYYPQTKKQIGINVEAAAGDNRLSLDRELKTTMNFTAAEKNNQRMNKDKYLDNEAKEDLRVLIAFSGQMPDLEEYMTNGYYDQEKIKSVRNLRFPRKQKMNSQNFADDLNPDQITDIQRYLEKVKVDKINKSARPTNIKYCTTVGGQRSRTPCQPINTWSNDVNYPKYPKGVDVQESVPDFFEPVNYPRKKCQYTQSEFRNGFGPGSGFDNGIDMRQKDTRSRPRANNDGLDVFDGCERGKNFRNPYEYGGNSQQLGSIYYPNYIGPYAAKPETLDRMGLTEQMQLENFPGAMRNINVESALIQKELTHGPGPGKKDVSEEEINRFELLPFDPQDSRHIVWEDNMPRGGYPTRVDRLETF